MQYLDEAAALSAHFATHVTTALGLPTAFDNAEFEPPRDVAAQEAPYLIHSIRWDTNEAVDTSAARWRIRGEVTVTIRVPRDQGSAGAELIAGQITAIYKRASIANVRFEKCALRNVGPIPGWWQSNLHMPFYADEVS